MSHVMDLPDTLGRDRRIQGRDQRALHHASTPPTSTSSCCTRRPSRRCRRARRRCEAQAAEGPVTLKTADVAQISGDIMGQIYARDFKMIDQSDMIVSLVPELPNGKPALSSGVERELHHAFEGGKEVYVIWACRGTPSPFITETATRVFRDTSEAMEYFRQKGYLA